MTETLKARIKTSHADVEFLLTFDPAFIQDRTMRMLLERDGACEPEVVHLMTRVLKSGDIAIDGGANVGFFTLLMSKLVGPSGLVYAVEPTPINIVKLEHNLANNKTSNVRVVKTVLYDRVADLKLHMAVDTGSNSVTPFPQAVGNMKVVSTTIDAMLDGQMPKLIKLDVEGAELKALEGGTFALQPYPYVVCEMNQEALGRCGASQRLLRVFMAGHGFDLWVLNADGSLPRYVPPDVELKCQRPNFMGLFATEKMVAEAWPEAEVE